MEEYEYSPEMANKKWSPGYLYILDYGDGHQIKIGITKGDPEKRVNQIKRGSGQLLPNPIDAKLLVTLEMSTNPYYLEQLLHMKYAHLHVGGEWFEFDTVSDIADLVSSIEDFGSINYYDAWYDKFDYDYIAYVIAGVYPCGLSYSPNSSIQLYSGKYTVECDTETDKVKLIDTYSKSKSQSSIFEDAKVDFRIRRNNPVEFWY